MKADHAPKLEIENWGIDINELNFELRNLGNGVAKGMAIIVDLKVSRLQKKQHSIESIGGVSPLRREDIYSRSLEPRQNNSIPCSCVPDIELRSKKVNETGSMSKISSILDEWGCATVECKISVEFNYISTESDEIAIWHGKSNLEKDRSLEDLVESAYKTYDTDVNIPPENP